IIAEDGMARAVGGSCRFNFYGVPNGPAQWILLPSLPLYKDVMELITLASVVILMDVTQGNALDNLRQVDEIFFQAIKDAGIYDDIWQAFALFLPIETTGVQGD
ncbi:hypothetical protein M8C21_008385, partial [Ambrosia artemisiifolia]